MVSYHHITVRYVSVGRRSNYPPLLIHPQRRIHSQVFIRPMLRLTLVSERMIIRTPGQNHGLGGVYVGGPGHGSRLSCGVSRAGFLLDLRRAVRRVYVDTEFWMDVYYEWMDVSDETHL